MNKAFIAALVCATAAAVKIKSTALQQAWSIHDQTAADFCKMSDEDLNEFYQVLDVDKDGQIEIEELAQLAGEHLNEDEQEFLETHGEYLFGLADQTNDELVAYDEFLDTMHCVHGEPAFMWAARWADWSQGHGYIGIEDVANGWAHEDPSTGYAKVYAQLEKYDTEMMSKKWISFYEFW